jgi:transcriptional regulator with PAS, ATPase and Fis domain
VKLLTDYFMERLTRAKGTRKVLSDDVMKALLNYDWPGQCSGAGELH